MPASCGRDREATRRSLRPCSQVLCWPPRWLSQCRSRCGADSRAAPRGASEGCDARALRSRDTPRTCAGHACGHRRRGARPSSANAPRPLVTSPSHRRRCASRRQRLGGLLRALYQQAARRIRSRSSSERRRSTRRRPGSTASTERPFRPPQSSSRRERPARGSEQRGRASRVGPQSCDELAAAADAEASELAAAVAEREQYVADLRRRQELNTARIASDPGAGSRGREPWPWPPPRSLAPPRPPLRSVRSRPAAR